MDIEEQVIEIDDLNTPENNPAPIELEPTAIAPEPTAAPPIIVETVEEVEQVPEAPVVTEPAPDPGLHRTGRVRTKTRKQDGYTVGRRRCAQSRCAHVYARRLLPTRA